MAPQGQTVVRAAVQARLLGIRLLTLDARVVVGPADQPEPLVSYPQPGPARREVASGDDPHDQRPASALRPGGALRSGSATDPGRPGETLARAMDILAAARTGAR